MKLWLSKPREGKKQHIVLDMTIKEDYDAYRLVREMILPRGVKPVRQMGRNKVRYRFNKRYLDRLTLVFPFADMSPGVLRYITRATEAEWADVPDIQVPGLDAKLYDYQKIGVRDALHGLEEEGAYLLNDEMGLGKTIQAISVLLITNAFPALIVCPNNAKWVWQREFRKFTDIEPMVVDGTAAQRAEQIAFCADVTITNFETLRRKDFGEDDEGDLEYEYANPDFFEIDYSMLVADEFHRVKNPTSQQTKGFIDLSHELYLGMSGTPILNRPEEAWTALHKTDPDRYPSYWAFEKNLCIKGKYNTIGYRPEAMAELKEDLRKHSTRRRKDQVLKDLPKVVELERPVTLRGEQRRLYDQIVNESKLELESGEKKGVTSVLAMITRCKQAAFSPELYGGSAKSAKIDELKDVVKELVDNGEKAIIFTQWSSAAKIIRREMEDYDPAYVDGGVKGKKRMAQVDKFNQSRDCKLYIGTIGANKESITLSAATYVIFMDKDWNPQNNNQALSRSAAGGLRGVGQKKPVHILHIIAENTIEQRIEQLLEEKQDMFNALVEKDGGVRREKSVVQSLVELFDVDPEEVAT